MKLLKELVNHTGINITTLADELVSLCDNVNLVYDNTKLPVKIGPDCYMFYATHLTNECKSWGQCRSERYYAIANGTDCVILDKDTNRL